MLDARTHALGLFGLAWCHCVLAQEAETVRDALTKATPTVNVTYRVETVSDEAFENDALASTLRTTLAIRTLPYHGVSGFLQFQNVVDLGAGETHNNAGAGHLGNGVTDRPVVADPAETRFQQGTLRLDGFDTAIDLGRREIVYGDHRFIGDVRWRQNHQTFDAVYLVNRSRENVALSYTFAANVVRITGAELEMTSHFLNGLVSIRPDISLELFGYLLDFDEAHDSGLSSKTFGFRLQGSPELSEPVRAHFELEYASQSDHAENPASFDAAYLELMGGIGFGEWLHVKVGRERLGDADGPLAFQTPLATGHKFQGWADKFLRTPEHGLVDVYVSLHGTVDIASWLVRYHDFRADAGGASFGRELDAQLTVPTPWEQLVGAKVAFYRENGFSTDTTKLWFWTHYRF